MNGIITFSGVLFCSLGFFLSFSFGLDGCSGKKQADTVTIGQGRVPFSDRDTSVCEVRNAADCILSCTYPDGAINMSSELERVWISPYFANLASWGLLRAYAVTRDVRYLRASRAWLRWYASHLAEDGTVNDYSGGRFPDYQDTGDYDSADAYAATFIYAAWLDGAVSGEQTLVKELLPAVQRAMTAIESLKQEDGLTWAKTSYRAKYLADNIEVRLGVLATAEICVRHLPSRRLEFIEWAGQIRQSLQHSAWIPEERWYRAAVDAPLQKEIYPGAFANLWAATFLLDPRSPMARELLERVYAWVPPVEAGFDPRDTVQPLWYALAAQRVGMRELAVRALSEFRKIDNEAARYIQVNAWLIFLYTDAMEGVPDWYNGD